MFPFRAFKRLELRISTFPFIIRAGYSRKAKLTSTKLSERSDQNEVHLSNDFPPFPSADVFEISSSMMIRLQRQKEKLNQSKQHYEEALKIYQQTLGQHAPKQPLSGFEVFLKEFTNAYGGDFPNPDGKGTQVQIAAEKAWKLLDETEKQKFTKDAANSISEAVMHSKD